MFNLLKNQCWLLHLNSLIKFMPQIYTSLGGAVAYYLHNKRPDKIQRAMLVCPAIPACVDKDLAKGTIVELTTSFASNLATITSTGRNDNERKKKNPVPTFFN